MSVLNTEFSDSFEEELFEEEQIDEEQIRKDINTAIKSLFHRKEPITDSSIRNELIAREIYLPIADISKYWDKKYWVDKIIMSASQYSGQYSILDIPKHVSFSIDHIITMNEICNVLLENGVKTKKDIITDIIKPYTKSTKQKRYLTIDNVFNIVKKQTGLEMDKEYIKQVLIELKIIKTRIDKSKFINVRYVNIKNSYTENIKSNWKTYRGNPEFFEENVKQKNITAYEILPYDKLLRFYIDIEKIPFEQDNLIKEICLDIIEFIKEKGFNKPLEFENLAITENKNSTSHEGRSYHVIIPVILNQNNMKRFLLNFVNDERYNKYIEYIDCSVYSRDRLFRLPYQIGFDKSGNRIENNIHVPIFNKKQFEDYVIQNTYNGKLPMFNPKNLTTVSIEQKRKAAKISGNIKRYGIKAALDERILASILAKANRPVEPESDEILKLIEKLRQKHNISKRTAKLLDDLDDYYEENGNFQEFRFSKQQIKNLLSSLI